MSTFRLDEAQLCQLASHGYLSLTMADFVPLFEAYKHLFSMSTEYFALDESDPGKKSYRAVKGAGGSEEGWSAIPGEKQIFTSRCYSRTPGLLRDNARQVWNATGSLLECIMKQIEESLELEHRDVYEPLLGDCLKLHDSRTPTLLRLFRYERPQVDDNPSLGTASRVVAEEHKDLGLLSVVVGSSPGLEVFDGSRNTWHSIEQHGAHNSGELTITLLVGQTLRFLSRGQYRAGVHRVFCSAMLNSDGLPEPYRYSVVYALRGYPAKVQLDRFESAKVGHFTPAERTGTDGLSAQVLFNKLCSQHWNVNIAKDIREKQRLATNASKTQSQQKAINTCPTLNPLDQSTLCLVSPSGRHAECDSAVPVKEQRNWWSSLRARLIVKSHVKTALKV